MLVKQNIAVSVGDLNGIGLEIALKAHEKIKELCTPLYAINESLLLQGAKKLNINIPDDFKAISCTKAFKITPGIATKESGKASYDSFLTALKLTQTKRTDALVTLPINKEAWSMARISYKGHTDALSDILNQDAIMMLGCDKLYTALFTHHIPLKDVPKLIKPKKIRDFLLSFYEEIQESPIGVLGLNPHAGDNGVIGAEDKKILKAIQKANKKVGQDVFIGPLVPDTAFSKKSLEHINYFTCMYHDQGLTPLKALYFDESINVSLGLSIIRTSVDHGTAYDIAYKNQNPSLKSYINAVKYALKLIEKG